MMMMTMVIDEESYRKDKQKIVPGINNFGLNHGGLKQKNSLCT